MDRLEAMSLFVAVVEAGGFSAASRRLGVPLATVSRKVADLERHLKTRLLLRSTRKLALTEAGAPYFAAAKRILEQVAETERVAAGEFDATKGELVLTAPLAFGRLHVLPVVSAFLREYPEIDVRLILSDRNIHLVDDQVDMAVRIGPLPDSAMVATRVGEVFRIVCASPAVLTKHGIPRSPADLAALPCIVFDGIGPGSVWRFAAPGRARESTVPVRPRLLVNGAEAAVDTAIAEIGFVQLLSYQAAGAIAAGLLVPVLRKFERAPLPVSLLHAGQGDLPHKMRRFLDFAAPRLRRSLAP